MGEGKGEREGREGPVRGSQGPLLPLLFVQLSSDCLEAVLTLSPGHNSSALQLSPGSSNLVEESGLYPWREQGCMVTNLRPGEETWRRTAVQGGSTREERVRPGSGRRKGSRQGRGEGRAGGHGQGGDGPDRSMGEVGAFQRPHRPLCPFAHLVARYPCPCPTPPNGIRCTEPPVSRTTEAGSQPSPHSCTALAFRVLGRFLVLTLLVHSGPGNLTVSLFGDTLYEQTN